MIPANAISSPPVELIDAACVHLRTLGLLGEDVFPSWRLLGGGVSNWVLRFDSGGGVVVKAALAKLRVAEEWLADPTRAVLEGKAMTALAAWLPAGDLPQVLFIDEQRHLLGMTCAPDDAFPWKDALLRGVVGVKVPAAVGALLGRMHRASWEDTDLAHQFSELALFRQLRLDPYHERAAQVAEDRGDQQLAGLLRQGAEAMTRNRCTLTHGDFSPKNLLVHSSGVMALDFEVVHWGNPAFDTAFLLTHLTLKAIHRPWQAAEYASAATTFLDAYGAALGHLSQDTVYITALQQAGCLLVARADGKSPAEYLSSDGRLQARRVGAAILRGQITSIPQLYEAIHG